MTIFYKDRVTATIAINETSTAEINLGQPSDFIQVEFPAMTAGTIKLQGAWISGGTFQDIGNAVTTESFSAAHNKLLRCAGYQFIKIVSSASQAAARTITLRGGRY